MPDEAVATNGVPAAENTPAQPNAVSQPPAPDLEAIRKAARLEAQREANTAAQRREAAIHKQYQAQLKAQREVARGPLQKAGYEPEAVFDDFDVRQKASQYDALTAQAEQGAIWQQHVESTATAYGLQPGDSRLDVSDVDPNRAAQVLIERAQAAMKEDAAKLREAAMKDAQAARLAQAEAKVENGDLDTLGGAPSAGNLSRSAKLAQAQTDLKALLNAPGKKDLKRIGALKDQILAK
jgi:hypothetical protein